MMHLYKDEHIKDGRVHSQRIMQGWDGVPAAEDRLNLRSRYFTSLSAFWTQIWAGQRLFVSSLLPETRLEVSESTAERKHRNPTWEFLMSERGNLE